MPWFNRNLTSAEEERGTSQRVGEESWLVKSKSPWKVGEN